MGDIHTYSDLFIMLARTTAFALGVGFVVGLAIMVPFYRDEWSMARHRPTLRRRIKRDIIKTAIWLVLMLSAAFGLALASF